VTPRWLGYLTIAAIAHDAIAEPAAAPLARPDATPTAARARPASAARARALDPSNLRTLTDDPELGKASRIDGDERKGMVAFTFDDGPNPETTPRVIDALEKYDIPATFFIVTQRISGRHGEASREILRRELDAGFQIGSHSVSHANLKRATADKLTREVDGSIRALAVQADRPIGLFRAPYGAINAEGRGRLHKLGLTEVFWSVDTLDWKAHDANRLRKKVLSMIKADGGGVVLMHDAKSITAGVIADVLDDLEAENCARLADRRDPILPVSLHYFLKDGRSQRDVPEAVKRRTAAYLAALPRRCVERPALPEPSQPLPAP
jgi:peptidoglycan/xylan/chitin deacetylase (PgdA/CDA1 family)